MIKTQQLKYTIIETCKRESTTVYSCIDCDYIFNYNTYLISP